nr:PREDICTED: chymotrypsinogen B-like [Lepisosteus oculatus]
MVKKRKITAIEVHPKYSLFYGDYDLALVRVDKLEFSEAVSPVCLPSGVLESSSICVLTGWSVVNGQRASSLQQRLVPIQDSGVCNKSRPPCGTERMCPLSSISGSSRCPFDTGDPLVCKSGGVFVLGGVQGGHTDCGGPVCVHSRVGAMVGWIKDVIRHYALNGELQSDVGKECPTDLELPAPPEALLSPPYAPNLACSWVLRLGERRRAEVAVSKVHTPSMDCRSTFFSIEQQTGNQTLLLDRFCGKLKYPYKVYSLLSDDKSFLRFSYKTNTDDPSPDYGFSLTYKYVPD